MTVFEINEIRTKFPITKNKVFLNHAATSPLSGFASDEMTGFIKRMANLGPTGDPSIYLAVSQAKKLSAEILGTSPEKLALVNNTSHGLSIVAAGLDWQEGENIIINDLEFPSNVYPWLNLKKKGVEVRILPTNEGQVDINDIFKAVDDKTRIISISWVEFSTGFKNDLERIGKLCQDRGILFVVDGSQGVGALNINLDMLDIDFLASCTHKWLTGPQGIGLLYLSDRAKELVRPVIVGWHSVKKDSEYLDYQLTFKDDARRFEEGTLNLVGIYGLMGSLKLFRSVGLDVIEKRVISLTSYLVDLLLDKDYSVTSSRKDAHRSGIVSFIKDDIDCAEIVSRLLKHDIIISTREGMLRASPHFYNTEAEIEILVNNLP